MGGYGKTCPVLIGLAPIQGLMYALAHTVFAIALAYLLRFPVVTAAVASILPDTDAMFDLGYPLVHRGVMHTPLAALFVGAAVFLVSGRLLSSYGAVLGYVSHLFLDSFTPTGILWLFPWRGRFSLMLATAANLWVNLAIAGISFAVALGWSYRGRWYWWKQQLYGWLWSSD